VAELVTRLLWPTGLLNKLGRLLGALSILGLIQHGFVFGFAPVLNLLLEYYDKLLGFFLGWAEPFIKACLAHLRDYIGWPLTLYPHWKHVFVLLGIYFFREVGVGRSCGAGYVIFNFLLGLVVALACGVVAGTIPLTRADPASNFVFAAVPILGAVVYGVIGFVWDATFLRYRYAKDHNTPIPTWWAHFSWGLSRIFRRSLAGLVLIWVGLQIPIVQQISSPGLAMSVVLVIAFALYWLWDGVRDGGGIRREGEPFRAAYFRSFHTQLGIAMLGTVFWGVVFIATGAGLALVGL
jgi:hypothetical protein